MRRLSLAILIIAAQSSYSQASNDSLNNSNTRIVNATRFKKGVYKTFEEFKFNNPSIIDSFFFDSKRLWLIESASGVKKRIKKDEVWGFCDGTEIYFWWNKYNRLQLLGRYCYFNEGGWRFFFRTPSTNGFPFNILLFFVPMPYNEKNIIDFNDGEVYILRKKIMKEILQDDPDLLNQFLKDNTKNENLVYYLKIFNRRNASKIE